MKEITLKIIKKIEEYDKIIIVRHKRPDGDCVGASFGLRALLRNTYPNKEIVCFGKDEAQYLEFLGKDDEAKSEEYYKDALIIVVDTANKDRVSDDYFEKGKEIIKIDHHIVCEEFGDISWVDEESAAACCLITKLWMYNQDILKINQEAAKCLYTGIVTDSGRFKYSCKENDLFACANELMKVDIDLENIYSNLYLKDFKDVKVSGELTRKIKFSENGVSYLYVTKKLQKKYNLSQEAASNVVGLMDSIKGSLIYIAFIDNPDGTIRVRLRSRFTDVDEIARRHNGGGHKKASGATAYSKKEMNDIIKEADQALKEYKDNNKGWL